MKRSRAANIATVPFDESCLDAIAAILGAGIAPAPFRIPGVNAWQLTIPATEEHPAVRLTFWIGLHRVDVISGMTAVVFNEVIEVDLVPVVEVQFRTKTRGMLIVARRGNVIVKV